VFADRSLIIGAPARRIRELTDDECRALEKSAASYAERGRQYRRELVAHDR
jgi:carbonic anhydrase/acetyltransferase-like protein (isoleucine patch superfamily)